MKREFLNLRTLIIFVFYQSEFLLRFRGLKLPALRRSPAIAASWLSLCSAKKSVWDEKCACAVSHFTLKLKNLTPFRTERQGAHIIERICVDYF